MASMVDGIDTKTEPEIRRRLGPKASRHRLGKREWIRIVNTAFVFTAIYLQLLCNLLLIFLSACDILVVVVFFIGSLFIGDVTVCGDTVGLDSREGRSWAQSGFKGNNFRYGRASDFLRCLVLLLSG